MFITINRLHSKVSNVINKFIAKVFITINTNNKMI